MNESDTTSRPPHASDESTEHDAAKTRMQLAEPTWWTRRLKITGFALLAALAWFNQTVLATLTSSETSIRMLVVVAAPPIAFVLWILWRWWDTPRAAQSIEFDQHEVHLPLTKNTQRCVSLRYTDIQGILSMARARSKATLIDTGELTLVYEDRDFAAQHQPEASKKLRDQLDRRIAQLPAPEVVLERMQDRFDLGSIASSKPTPITVSLLGILLVYFALELLTGALSAPLGLLNLGANAPVLVESGQYWRLISANFLHGGWIHIFFNAVALYFLGIAVEKLVGSWRMLLIYLVSAIVGCIGSWLFGPGAFSVGASTGIMGLFGAFLALHLRYWSQLPPPFRQSKKWWIFIVSLNIALTLVFPAIDYAAHLAGLAAGLVLTLSILRSAPQLQPERPTSKTVRLLAGGVSALSVAALIFAALYAYEPHPRDGKKVLLNQLEVTANGSRAPERINAISWQHATYSDAKKEHLLLVRDALSKILARNDDLIELRDTAATLDYRLARMLSDDARLESIERAITGEIALLNVDHEKSTPDLRVFFGGQLARFLDYRHALDEPVDPDGLLSKPLQISTNTDKKTLALKEFGNVDEDASVYVITRQNDALYGLFRGCLLAGTAGRSKPSFGTQSIYENLGEQETLKFEPVLVQRDARCRLKNGSHGKTPNSPAAQDRRAPEFWPMTEEVEKLP